MVQEGHRRAAHGDSPFQAETVGKGRTGLPEDTGFSGTSTHDKIRGKTMSKDITYSLVLDGMRIRYVNAMFGSAVRGIWHS